ncbi:MAG TPA: helix-turn-helix transcriptional regulator, partial [Nitriliruptorales bacterium]
PWPDGPIRAIPDNEGGESTRYAVEQVVRLIKVITERRERRGLHRAQLARMCGVRPATISDLELGNTWPDFRTLALIAWALEADVEFVPRRAKRALDQPEGEDQ